MAAKHKRQIARHLFGQSRLMESPAQRELMAATLALSSDPRMRDLAARTLSPSMRGTSFATICDDLSLSWSQVEQEFRSIKKSEGYIRASQHLPELMEQSAVDAKGKMQPCRTCKATGKVGDDICTVCWGRNEIYVPGEIDRQKLVFETFGLIGKNGGFNVNLDLRRVDQSEGLEELSQSVAGILEGKVNECDP